MAHGFCQTGIWELLGWLLVRYFSLGLSQNAGWGYSRWGWTRLEGALPPGLASGWWLMVGSLSPPPPMWPSPQGWLSVLMTRWQVRPRVSYSRDKKAGVPTVATQSLGGCRVEGCDIVSGLRVQCCHKLQCGSRMQLGSCLVVAVA